jgi:hypothetical protein
MPKDNEKYQYFTVGLERTSWALEQFKADAKKHHMSDQPGKLIALRLTEYYEWLERGMRQSLVRVPIDSTNVNGHKPSPGAVQRFTEEEMITVSEDVDRNAEEAADYWSTL